MAAVRSAKAMRPSANGLIRLPKRRKVNYAVGIAADPLKNRRLDSVHVVSRCRQVLVVSELTKSFGGTSILKDVGFSLRPGAITCLTGGNGSGKTTLLNLLTGYLRPDAGTIRLGNEMIAGLAPFRINRLGLARTFQDLRLIGKMTARENVLLALPRHGLETLSTALLPRCLRRWDCIRDDDSVDDVLAQFCLTDVAHVSARDLSYGQQKLLTLACCCATGARILLFDEPVAGISSSLSDRIAALLKSLRSMGRTILLIEHQTNFLAQVGDHFLHLHASRLQFFESFIEYRTAIAAT